MFHVSDSVAFYGILASALSSVTWAVGVSAYSLLARDYPPWVINFLRAALSLPLFLLMAFAQSGGWAAGLQALSSVPGPSILWFALSILMSYGLGDVFFLWSTRGIGVPAALAIASTYPLWAVLVNWIFRGEILGPLKMLGLLMVVLGTVIVILSARDPAKEQPKQKITRLDHKYMGAFLAILTSAMWAVNAYSIFRGGEGVSTPVANSYRMCFAILMAPLLGQLYAPRVRPLISREAFRKYGWVFFVEGFGGTYFFMYGLSHAPLAIGTALSSLAPVLAVPITLITRAEKFSLAKTLGVFVVVGGLFLLVGVN